MLVIMRKKMLFTQVADISYFCLVWNSFIEILVKFIQGHTQNTVMRATFLGTVSTAACERKRGQVRSAHVLKRRQL